MGKKVILILAYGAVAAVFTLAFEYLGDEHQGLLVFASIMLAISIARRSPRVANPTEA